VWVGYAKLSHHKKAGGEILTCDDEMKNCVT